MESAEQQPSPVRARAIAGGPDRLLAARFFREEAVREGFVRAGIARAGRPPRFDRFERWIAAGRHAGMRYLEETARVRADPEELLPGASPSSASPRPTRPSRASLRTAPGSRGTPRAPTTTEPFASARSALRKP